MYLGVDYYPEQWDASMMDDDLDNIAGLGCNVIRIAEFGWHIMERREGQFDFSFFDTVIEKAKKRGLKIIMGTPTATIPAWLAKKHPDILSEFEDGRKRSFGGRHVYCFNSPELYAYSEKIIRAQAEHYKDEKAIVAWQLDNEWGHEGSDLCYCPRCRKAFQVYLRWRFKGDIDRLNETFGTVFWSQQYNGFDEIPVPAETITTHNPSLRMEWERFRNKSIVDYAAFQAKLLKEIIPDCVLIHDFPGGCLDKHYSYADLAKHIDITAYNNYPVWGGQKEPLAPYEVAFDLDLMRGLKQANFWITEAIMGAQGHDVTGYSPRPDQAKLWSYQSMAHGCESLLYFRYRGAAKGAEQFCYGILDTDNRKGRKYREVRSFFAEIGKYAKALEAPVKSDVALVYGYDSLAAFRIQRQSLLIDCKQEMLKYYRAFYEAGVSVDVVPEGADLSGFRILILPLMIVMDGEMKARVRAFAENGGTVILTYRTAVKDEYNNLTFGEVLPVGLSDMAGVTVEETESLQETDAFPLTGEGAFAQKRFKGGVFRDMLAVTGPETEILCRYGDPFYEGFAAVTRKRCGKGTVYYVGCSPEKAFFDALAETVLADKGIAVRRMPEGIECVSRGSGEEKILFVMNHNAVPAETEYGTLAPYECRIIAG